MRILHTSDWHLGRDLEGLSRLDEQKAFVDELVAHADAERVDLVLVAGDGFQSYNPAAAAEALFYDALDRLSAGGRRAVVAIAGNHCSPERFTAASPLARTHGIALFGYPSDEPVLDQEGAGADRVRFVAGGPSWVEVAVPGCPAHAVVLALAYPSEARLLLAPDGEEAESQVNYADQVRRIFAGLEGHFRADTVNVAMSHLFLAGGQPSDSEQEIQVGGAYSVPPDALPATAQYVALGHLHRPQAAGGLPHVRYSGSPLAYSFSEAGQAKSVVLVDLEPGEEARIREIPITCGRPLRLWRAASVEQVLEWCAQGKDEGAFIDLEVQVAEHPAPGQVQAIKALRDFVYIRPVLPEAAGAGADGVRETLSERERLQRFFRLKNQGREVAEELVDLCQLLLQEARTGAEPEAEAEVAAAGEESR